MSRTRIDRKRSAVGPRLTLTGEIELPVAPPILGDDEPKKGRGLILAVVAIALLMSSIDQTIVATALTTIQRDLHSSIEWSSWTITIYSLGQILVLPVAGKLSDAYGRKRVFLVAIVIFTVASLCCGLADNIYVLVALRAVQAIGGAAFLPSATGIIADTFGRDRDRALGMFTSIFPFGAIVGPILGGILVTSWSWRGIFLVNVPAGVLLVVLAAIFIPRSAPRPSGSFDVWGIVFLGVFLLSAMFGVAQLGSGETSLLSIPFIVPELVAVVFVVFFLLRVRYARSPFIPVRLLYGHGFGVMNLINFFYGAAALGFAVLVPLYAQDRFDVPILESGTLLATRAIGMICISSLASLALRRTGYRLPMVLGFSITAAGFAGMALVPAGVPPFLWVAIASGVSGIGLGLSQPASNNAVIQLAPDQAAAIAGLRGMFRQSGSIIAVSVTTALAARSADPAMSLTIALLASAVVLILVLPLVRFVPEHRGSW